MEVLNNQIESDEESKVHSKTSKFKNFMRQKSTSRWVLPAQEYAANYMLHRAAPFEGDLEST